MEKQYYVYIMTNRTSQVLYTGVTNDLQRRVFEHKNKINKGFTAKYHIDKLAYYEVGEDIEGVYIKRESHKSRFKTEKDRTGKLF